jgi:hypothetical protein
MAPTIIARQSETTPLLPKPDQDAHPIDAGVGIAPEGPDGGDIERQTSHGDAFKHQGMPEVRKRMKYIFPAICIGVSKHFLHYQLQLQKEANDEQVFLSAADQTLVVTTYGTIGTELHALSSTSWIATGYFLTLSAFQPLYGKLSDIFGRKQCLLFAYLIFGIGSVGCGLARNIGELVAARAFAGVGGGGMNVCTSIMMSDILGLRERGTWQGYVNVVYATGAAAGARKSHLQKTCANSTNALLFQLWVDCLPTP